MKEEEKTMNRQQRRAAASKRMKSGTFEDIAREAGAASKRTKSVTLEDFVREAAGVADRMFDAHGEITPFWLVDAPKATAMIVTPIDAESAEEAREVKNAVSQKMREFMREHGATRYVFVAETWAYAAVRQTSNLPEDEGTVFVTAVADAPIQVLGRRGNDGQLYVGSTLNAAHSPSNWSEAMKNIPDAVEVITGAEAEQLLADIQAEREWDGVSLETHPRRREIVALAAEDHTQMLVGTRDIIRSEGGKPRLSALEVLEGDGRNRGPRFAGLLPERVVH
jgi:hypothetical protein